MKKNNKLVTILLASSLLLPGIAPLATGVTSVAAATETVATAKQVDAQYVTVVDQVLRNVRSDQAVSNGFVPAGKTVTNVRDAGKGWFQVDYDGNTGYIQRSEVTSVENYENMGQGDIHNVPAPKESKRDAKYIVAVTTGLRTKDVDVYRPLRMLKSGEEVEYLGTTTNGWFKVKDKNGVEGYVNTGDVTSVKNYNDTSTPELHDVETTNETKREGKHELLLTSSIRTKDNRAYRVIAELQRGDVVTYLGTTDNDWFKVKTEDGKIGFIYRGDVTAAEEEEALVIDSVSPINAKTLKVTMNRAVSAEDQAKAKVEAKRGSIKPSVKEVKFAEDGKSVTIEFNANMIAGDYTVTVSGLTEEALTGTAKVEAEKLTEINFLSETAIISGNNVTTRVEARNQYGEVVNKELNSSKSNISVTASKGTPGSHTINNEGLLTVVGTSGDFKADNKVVVTIVDSSTGVTATKTLTVVQSAQVESIEVGELTTDDEELAKKPVNVTNMGSNASDYYIPVTVKDQYGNTLKAADLNGDVDVLSSNKKVVQVADTAFADLKDVGTVIKFKAPEATATHGTAVLTIVAPGTGKSANVSVEVLKDAEIDTLTVSAPEKALKKNVKVDLPFSAADQYGDMLESSTELVKHSNTSPSKIVFANNDGSAGASINATGANLDYSIDYGNKNKVKLHITPTAKNIVLTSVSATGKAQTINLTAEEAPEASSLAGISKDIFTAMQKDENQVISHTHVIINDQYGDSIGLPNGYKLKFAAEDGTLDNVTLNNAEITNTGTTSTTLSAAVKGNEAIKITLNDGTKDLDTVVVTFETVELKDITEFGLKEVGKIYTGKAADVKYGNIPGDYDKSLEIFGKKGSKEVLVDQGLLLSATSTAPIVVNGLGIDHQEVTTNGVDKTATLTAVIQGADSPITATQELVYSDAKSLVSKVTVRETTGSKAEITDGAVVVPTGKIGGKEIGPKATTDASTFQFYAKDQYGVEVTNLDYTVTNLKSSNNDVSKVEVNNDGTITVTDSGSSGLQAGDTFTITAIVDGIVTTVKVIVGA